MSSQTVEIIDRDTAQTIVTGPMIAIPRVDDTVALRGIKYTVNEVVFAFDNVTRVGMKTQAELAIHIYVKRDR
jgi:hypothetical protein